MWTHFEVFQCFLNEVWMGYGEFSSSSQEPPRLQHHCGSSTHHYKTAPGG